MQLSTRARYATRAMIELAMKYGTGHVQLKEIAREQDISEKYLEQILLPLRLKGYISTQKGSRGGYRLVKSPEEVTLLEIIEVTEGTLAPVPCVEERDQCHRDKFCATRDVWVRLRNAIRKELGSVTLGGLVSLQLEKYGKAMGSSTYQI